MREFVAYLLRSLAERISPAPADPIMPLTFIGTEDLAKEIISRNDIAVLIWGREATAKPGRFKFKTSMCFRLGRCHCGPLLERLSGIFAKEFDLNPWSDE